MADTQVYGTMCTDIGNAAIANSVLTGTKVNFAQIVVGDGNGTPYVPVSGQTSLKHQVWSGAIAEVTQDPDQMNRMILHAVLPSSVGGWVMREIGVLDDKGQLLAVGNTPEIPKEVVTSGAIMEMDLYIYISVVDARGVNVIIDPTVIIATKADINKLWDTVNKLAQSVKLGDNVYAAKQGVITIPGADSTHDGYMAKEQAVQLAQAVPNTRKVAGHALTGDVTISANDVGAVPDTHTSENISTESGVHGLRWYNKQLQAKISDSTWEIITIGGSDIVRYGVRWYYTQPSPVLERLYDSVNFKFQAKSSTGDYHSDFDDKPIYKDIKVCNVSSGKVTAYQGEAGFSRTGSNDVMVEIPRFYYKVEDSGTYRDYIISNAPLTGFLPAPRHAPCGDYPNGLNKIYIGAYEAGTEYSSVSGATRYVRTRAEYRQGFSNRGAGYLQVDIATQFELELLIMIEIASLNTQSKIGTGYVGNGGISDNASPSNSGRTDVLGAITGSSGNNASVVWRGIENLWGNINEFRDGININDDLIYVCLDPSKYADNTATNYLNLAYRKIKQNGYISATGLDPIIPWVQMPTAVNGSTGTYLCDLSDYNSGWRVLSVGGSYNSYLTAGLFSLDSSLTSTSHGIEWGSRLLVLPQQ